MSAHVVAIPARALVVFNYPRTRRVIADDFHAILAESLRLGDEDAVKDLQGMACELWKLWGQPDEALLQRRMREVRIRTKGRPFVLETPAGPIFITGAVWLFFNEGAWDGNWRRAFVRSGRRPSAVAA